jgi:hypothetical protein
LIDEVPAHHTGFNGRHEASRNSWCCDCCHRLSPPFPVRTNTLSAGTDIISRPCSSTDGTGRVAVPGTGWWHVEPLFPPSAKIEIAHSAKLHLV